jgi:hypothetical protein
MAFGVASKFYCFYDLYECDSLHFSLTSRREEFMAQIVLFSCFSAVYLLALLLHVNKHGIFYILKIVEIFFIGCILSFLKKINRTYIPLCCSFECCPNSALHPDECVTQNRKGT